MKELWPQKIESERLQYGVKEREIRDVCVHGYVSKNQGRNERERERER